MKALEQLKRDDIVNLEDLEAMRRRIPLWRYLGTTHAFIGIDDGDMISWRVQRPRPLFRIVEMTADGAFVEVRQPDACATH